MKKSVILFLILLLSNNTYSLSIKHKPYFSHKFDNSYVFLGNVIGVDTVFNYTKFDHIIGYVCSYQINVIEDFGLDISDSIWIYPNVDNNESLFEPVNYVSRYQSDIPRGLYYFRAFKRDDHYYYYNILDDYMCIPLLDDSVYGRFTKVNDYLNDIRWFLGIDNKLQKWNKSKFERILKRKLRSRYNTCAF